MSVQIRNRAMPGVPETDSNNWIVMQYDYQNSADMRTPGYNPELDGYPEKPGIIRNDASNVYVSGKWDVGYGKAIWAKIPMTQIDYPMIYKRTTLENTWSESFTWLTKTGVTSSTISVNTLNEYGLPSTVNWASYTAKVNAYTLSYLQGTYYTSALAKTPYENLENAIREHKWPKVNTNGTTTTASVIYIYDYVNGTSTETRRYDVVFPFGSHANVTVSVSCGTNRTTLAKSYLFEVFFEDSYAGSSGVTIYGFTPEGFWSNNGNGVVGLSHPYTLLIEGASDIYNGPCAWGPLNGTNYKYVGYENRTFAITPAIPHQFDTGDQVWVPVRQLHKRNGSAGAIYNMDNVGTNRFFPEYRTEIEYMCPQTRELFRVGLRRRDDYLMYRMGYGSGAPTRVWLGGSVLPVNTLAIDTDI